MEIEEVKQGQPERRITALLIDALADESRKVEGYAMLFDTPSDGLYFTEVIERGALDGVLEKSDVFAWMNHDDRRGLLARRNKKVQTLTLSIDEKGLRYSFEAPNTAIGDELLSNLRRGEISESSFAFTVKEELWERLSDGTDKRTIKKFERIYDVSPVYNGAYSKTSVYLRGKQDMEASEQAKKEEEKRVADLSAHLDSINSIINVLNY